MKRIILAIDHYNQLTYLHVRLKKIGFDVEGVQVQRGFEESLITFNPQLIIASTRGVKIDGFKIASEIKKNAGFPKIVLLKSSSKSYPAHAFDIPEIDKTLTSPFNIKDVIYASSALLKLDAKRLIDKYDKVFSKIDKEEELPPDWFIAPKGTKSGYKNTIKEETAYREPKRQPLDFKSLKQNINPEARKKRFEEFIEKMEPEKISHLSTKEVEEATKKIQSEKRTEETKHLDQQRMAFVKALFSHVK